MLNFPRSKVHQGLSSHVLSYHLPHHWYLPRKLLSSNEHQLQQQNFGFAGPQLWNNLLPDSIHRNDKSLWASVFVLHYDRIVMWTVDYTDFKYSKAHLYHSWSTKVTLYLLSFLVCGLSVGRWCWLTSKSWLKSRPVVSLTSFRCRVRLTRRCDFRPMFSSDWASRREADLTRTSHILSLAWWNFSALIGNCWTTADLSSSGQTLSFSLWWAMVNQSIFVYYIDKSIKKNYTWICLWEYCCLNDISCHSVLKFPAFTFKLSNLRVSYHAVGRLLRYFSSNVNFLNIVNFLNCH